jgi:hypothetical protein
MEDLLGGWYPQKAANTKFGSATMELWIGHDLLVKSILSDSKNVRNKMVFSKAIPKLQWDKFVSDEVAQGRTEPQFDMKYPTVTKKITKKKLLPRRASKQLRSLLKKNQPASKPATSRSLPKDEFGPSDELQIALQYDPIRKYFCERMNLNTIRTKLTSILQLETTYVC